MSSRVSVPNDRALSHQHQSDSKRISLSLSETPVRRRPYRYIHYSGDHRGVRMAPEPDIYDVIEADNTAMERVAKSRAAVSVANSTPTHSSNHSIIGRGILKRGKSSRRPGSDSGRTRAGFSDVKSVSRYACVCACRAFFFCGVAVHFCLIF